MPPINDYKCNKCGFSFPRGWGGFLFVENDKGERIVCPHPGERAMIEKVLDGNYLSQGRTIEKRVGYASICLCLDCLHQFTADLADEETKRSQRHYYKNTLKMIGGKDKRECPKCKSNKVKTLAELIDETCPKCHKGKIKEIETGIFS